MSAFRPVASLKVNPSPSGSTLGSNVPRTSSITSSAPSPSGGVNTTKFCLSPYAAFSYCTAMFSSWNQAVGPSPVLVKHVQGSAAPPWRPTAETAKRTCIWSSSLNSAKPCSVITAWYPPGIWSASNADRPAAGRRSHVPVPGGVVPKDRLAEKNKKALTSRLLRLARPPVRLARAYGFIRGAGAGPRSMRKLWNDF